MKYYTREEVENYFGGYDALKKKFKEEDLYLWSLKKDHTEDEILLYALANNIDKKLFDDGNNDICYSYLCEHSVLSEELIEQLMFISSPLFSFDNYNIIYKDFCISVLDAESKVELLQDFIISLEEDNNKKYSDKFIEEIKIKLFKYNKELKEYYEDLEKYHEDMKLYKKELAIYRESKDKVSKHKKPCKPNDPKLKFSFNLNKMDDRLDWKALVIHQSLSESFKNKHKLHIDSVRPKDKLSAELIELLK